MTVKDYNKAVEDYSNGIYRFILKNIKDQDKARDVVQDTFEKCWIKHETVDTPSQEVSLLPTSKTVSFRISETNNILCDLSL